MLGARGFRKHLISYETVMPDRARFCWWDFLVVGVRMLQPGALIRLQIGDRDAAVTGLVGVWLHASVTISA